MLEGNDIGHASIKNGKAIAVRTRVPAVGGDDGLVAMTNGRLPVAGVLGALERECVHRSQRIPLPSSHRNC